MGGRGRELQGGVREGEGAVAGSSRVDEGWGQVLRPGGTRGHQGTPHTTTQVSGGLQSVLGKGFRQLITLDYLILRGIENYGNFTKLLSGCCRVRECRKFISINCVLSMHCNNWHLELDPGGWVGGMEEQARGLGCLECFCLTRDHHHHHQGTGYRVTALYQNFTKNKKV